MDARIKLEEIRKRYEKYTDFLEKISAYYSHNLLHNAKIMDYVNRVRKFSIKSIEDFEIGFGGEGRELEEFVKANNIDRQLLVDTGVCYVDDNGWLRNRMFRRIVFPILDLKGKIIGFSGRVNAEDEKREKQKHGKVKGKFINTPNTLVFRKRFVVYGGFQALEDIIAKDFVIVVEGNPDVITMHQHKFTNTIAPCGTALTVEQLQILKSLTKNILISTDNDNAGKKAFERIMELNKLLRLNIRKLSIFDCKDLDEYLKSHKPRELEKIIQAALSY